ncbi:MAG: hypothetical protein PVJ76_05410 [Gemmatimonadota bacterium]|jgi:hypothetical protein
MVAKGMYVSCLLALLGTAAISCSRGGPADGVWGGEVVEGPDGWIVRNPEDPLEFRNVQHLWSRSSDTWGDPASVRISGNHAVIVDPLATKVHLLDIRDGSPETSFGQEGEGPGELGRIYAAALLDGSVYVSHSRILGLSVYSTEGRFQGSVPWGTHAGQLHSWGETALAGIPLAQSDRVAAKEIGAEADAEFVDPPFSSPFPESEFGSCIRATAEDGWIVRALCSALRIRVEGPGVETPFWIEHPSAPAEASDEELDRYLARFWEMESGGRELTPLVQRQLAGVREGARIRPVYSRIRIDPSSDRLVVLEQPFGDHGWDPGVFHVFLLNGLYFARAEPDLHIVDFDLKGDTVLVLARDADTHEVRVQALEFEGSETLEKEAASVPGPGHEGPPMEEPQAAVEDTLPPALGDPVSDSRLAVIHTAGSDWAVGDTLALSDLQGKPIVLDYWASWCAPWLAEHGAACTTAHARRGKVAKDAESP